MKAGSRKSLEVRYLSIDSVIPYERNSRTHSDEQVDEIARSIREFGFANPILVDAENTIIAGHGRWMAAQKIGLDTVPVIALPHLTEEQRRAYVIADNRLALNASWDDALLAEEIAALSEIGFDVETIGFNERELKALIAAAGKTADGLTDEDEVPDEPETAVSVAGDLWVLGKHRIICGDSTDGAVVARLLNGVVPHLMVTDPPYGVEYDPAWRSRAGVGKKNAVGVVLNDDNADWRDAWALFPGDVAYVWHAGKYASQVSASLEACEFQIRSQIIWAKDQIAISRGDYHWKHEPCWYAVRKSRVGHWNGGRKQSTVWNIPKPIKSETGHSTQKPVECMRRPIVNNSSPGQAVYEPFSGSGTTIIACEKEARSCFAVELHPAYVDIAVERWQQFTGLSAVLDGDGRTFAEVANDRLGAEHDGAEAVA